MPYNGSGSFNLAEPDFVPLTTISSAAMNSDLNDIASGLSICLTTDGQSQMGAQFKGFPGTVTAPGYSFSTDLNSGIYRIAADNIGVAAGGVKILDISSTGLAVTGDLTASGNFVITGTVGFTGLITGVNATLSGLLTLSSTSHMLTPSGTTAQRPGTPTAAAFRYNTDTGLPEFADGVSFLPLSAAQPIASGFKALTIQNNALSPNAQIDVDADAVTVENSSGRAFRLTGVNLTINCGVVGANGLDAGSLSPNTWYAVFVIYNPATGTTAGLASTSATSPTLPSGYTAVSRFGWMITNGSSFFHRVLQKGRTAQYVVSSAVTTALPTLWSGTGGTFSQTAPVYTTASITGLVPTTACRIAVFAYPGGNNSNIYIAPNSLYLGVQSGNPPPYCQVFGAGTNGGGATWMTLESTTLSYVSGSSALGVVFGWEDNL